MGVDCKEGTEDRVGMALDGTGGARTWNGAEEHVGPDGLLQPVVGRVLLEPVRQELLERLGHQTCTRARTLYVQ